MNKPKVLIVDERQEVQSFYREKLEHDVELLFGSDMTQAFDLFSTHWRDLKLIILDGVICGTETVQLAAFMHKRVACPMIATSGKVIVQKRLISEGGCKYPEPCKEKVETLTRNILNL